MTTSSSFEVEIRCGGRVVFGRRLDALGGSQAAADLLTLEAAEPFAVTVRRSAPDGTRLRLRLGTEIVAELPPGAAEMVSGPEAWLRDEFGESRMLLERETGAASRRFEAVFELGLAVSPRPEVARDFRVMVEDVAGVHQGLARDVVGRGMLRGGLSGGSVVLLHPEMLAAGLENLLPRLERSLAHIARQPSVVLDQTLRVGRYRGGDRLDARSAVAAVRDPATRLGPDGGVAALGKVLLRGVALSEDLPEHRHAAEGLRRLAQRAETLAAHCERSAELLQAEEARWGGQFPNRRSVYEQRDLPRVQALRELAARGRSLAESFRRLLAHHRFLAESGPPRTPFGPTPAFLGRAPYREVYRALLEARELLAVLVDGDAVRLVYRNLATLYEYWCFIRVVAHLHARYGAGGARQTFSLIDDIYRPELAPGQQFRFTLGQGAAVVATYQPEFHPWAEARVRGDRYGASLTSRPLRPDITLEVFVPPRPPVLLVLDAKSTDAFAPVKLYDMADYGRQVFELATGRQPIRQVFLLHRDRQARALCNLPGYLRGRRFDPQAMALGAVPCVPERVGHTPPLLATVIDRFLEVFAGASGAASLRVWRGVVPRVAPPGG